MASWQTRKALFLEVSNCPPATTRRILSKILLWHLRKPVSWRICVFGVDWQWESSRKNGVRRYQNGILLEDSHCRCGWTMRNLEEKCLPGMLESHFTRGFSLSLRAGNEKPRGKVRSGGAKVRSGGAKNAFYSRILMIFANE